MTPQELDQLAERLKTQDNRCTSHPMFIVQHRKRIYGMDPDYSSDVVWVDVDCNEVYGEELAEAKLAWEDTGVVPDGLTRTSYVDTWEFVTCCFTNDAAEKYIENNRHNLHDPRVYIESGYRNDEWIAIRKHFMG